MSTASLRACHRHHDAPLPSPPHLQGLPGAPTPGSPASFSCHPGHSALPSAAVLLGRNSSAAGTNHLWDRSPAPQLQPSDSCGATGSAGWGGPSTVHLLRPRLRAEITFSAPALSVLAASRVGAVEEGGVMSCPHGLVSLEGRRSSWEVPARPPLLVGAPREGTECGLLERTEGGPAASCAALFCNMLPPNTSPRSRFKSVESGCASPPLKRRGPCFAPEPSAVLGVH